MAWFTAKEWKNRLVEFAGRRSLKNVSTNETTVYDVTRNEGQVSQEGDSFSATTMNDLEQRISEGFSAAEEANSQLSSETEKLNIRCQRYVDYSDRGLASAIDSTFDLVVAELGNGFFSRVIETNEGYFALYGYLSVNMTGIATQIGADNTYMFYKFAGGADAVLKKLGSNIVYIGNSTSIDVKTVLPNDYANLTADNFIVELASLSANGGAANTGGASYPQFGSVNANSNMTKTYNNGVLTIQGIACSGETYSGDRTWRRYVSASAGIRVYAVY